MGKILYALCKQDPRYTYESIEAVLVHVHPQRGASDPFGLLDIRVSQFTAKGKIAPAAVIYRISEFTPELASFLRAKRDQYHTKQGAATGSPGAIVTGNMDPQIQVELQDMTVREILNNLVLIAFVLIAP